VSGGSFEYLCYCDDLSDLMGKRHYLGQMVDALAIHGAEDAAAETENLRALLAQTNVRVEVALKRLAPVWKAMEWWQSGDYGENQFHESVAEYRSPDGGES
jgi:hypothetical protein